MIGKKARDFLEEFGPTVNTILEVYPDATAKRAGQRWFMIVKKANLVLVHEKISVESCRWCKTNTLQPCPVYRDVIYCHIENVKAYGVREAPIFRDVASEPTPAPAAAAVPTTAQILAKIGEMSAAKAASQTRSQREVLPNQIVEECSGDCFCICSKCR
jgi:hypothetical protein